MTSSYDHKITKIASHMQERRRCIILSSCEKAAYLRGRDDLSIFADNSRENKKNSLFDRK